MCSLIFAQSVLGLHHDLIKNLFWHKIRLELSRNVINSIICVHGAQKEGHLS